MVKRLRFHDYHHHRTLRVFLGKDLSFHMVKIDGALINLIFGTLFWHFYTEKGDIASLSSGNGFEKPDDTEIFTTCKRIRWLCIVKHWTNFQRLERNRLELRQYKNDSMDWKKFFILNLPHFFARLLGERKHAANSKQRIFFSP